MFAIALKQEEQYQTYILSDDTAQSRIKVVPERGGIITSWRIQGQELLYLDTERFANPELSVRGGVPILFPICGNLPNNTYTHQGQNYTLKQHGFARDLPWEVKERITDDRAAITLSLTANEQTRAVYPFDFELVFTYQLVGNTLTILQRYSNHSSVEMPFASGLHPYFWTADKSQLEFDIPADRFKDHQTGNHFSFPGTFDWEKDEIDIALTPLSRHWTSIANQRRRLKITLNYSEIYSVLVFWTIKGKEYVCLEPWSSPRNALNTMDCLMIVPPHDSLESQVEMSVSYL